MQDQNPAGEPAAVHDYDLVAHHHFRSVAEAATDAQIVLPEIDWKDFQEKVVWVFRCRRTGELREVVHIGPYEQE